MKTAKRHLANVILVSEYIQQNLELTNSIDDLAKVAGVSKYHLNRLFTAHRGVSIGRFITLLRLKKASFQLAFEPDLSVLNIALEAGFDSHEAFSRAFKRSFEQTPSQFRHQPNWPNWHEILPQPLDLSELKGEKSMHVSIVEFPETKVASITHLGNPNRVFETAAKFIEWRQESGLSPIERSKTFGVPYGDPNSMPAEEFRFDICGSVNSPIPENNFGVKNSVLVGGRCAKVQHKGSHDNIGETVYDLYQQWLPQSGEELRDFPVFFHYLNFVHQVDECELLTDVYLPIV